MKKTLSFPIIVVSMLLLTLVLTQCKKPPTADFSYAPTNNPEAGDSIFFTNLSIEALTYEWDFGDGYSSTEENPYNTYVEAGSYNVTLTAFNDDGEHSITKPVTINDPTVLGFTVYEDDQTTVIPGASVWLYDNEYDWQEYNDPQFTATTNNDGIVLFLNLESQKYWVDVYKEVTGGYWYGYGGTDIIPQNEITSYWISLDYFLDEAKKSFKKGLRKEATILPPGK